MTDFATGEIFGSPGCWPNRIPNRGLTIASKPVSPRNQEKDRCWMQELLPTYSDTHHKLNRALAHLAGAQKLYSRTELIRLVKRMYPELTKEDLKPQKHCLNYTASANCPCSQTGAPCLSSLNGLTAACAFAYGRP